MIGSSASVKITATLPDLSRRKRLISRQSRCMNNACSGPGSRKRYRPRIKYDLSRSMNSCGDATTTNRLANRGLVVNDLLTMRDRRDLTAKALAAHGRHQTHPRGRLRVG